jgi:hypothetical protein
MLLGPGGAQLKHLFLAALLSSVAFGTEIFTNNPAWDNSSGVGSWGNGGATPTYGQTITVPADGNNILNSFTFHVARLGVSTSSINFFAYVQSWNGTQTTGSPLFTSGLLATNASPDFSTYTVNPNLALTPGNVYVLYFSTVGVANANTNSYGFGLTTSDTYAGGGFFYSNQDFPDPAAGSLSDLNTTWGNRAGDLAFTATFSGATPEPQSLGMCALGLVLVGLALRSHK